MMIELAVLVIAWMIAAGSPGPATLAISAIAMSNGRQAGITVAAGICCGSAFWGILSALGVGSLMLANAWIFSAIKVLGALYLLYLATKSLRSALAPTEIAPAKISGKSLFFKGALLHITNPKAILSWGAIFAVALPATASFSDVFQLFAILICASTTVFIGYGFLFALPPVSKTYRKLKRWFDTVFAFFFGALGIRLLTSKMEV